MNNITKLVELICTSRFVFEKETLLFIQRVGAIHIVSADALLQSTKFLSASAANKIPPLSALKLETLEAAR